MRIAYVLLAQDGITRRGARDEARAELSKRIYHLTDPSPIQRVMSWVWEHFLKLFSKLASITPGGLPSLLVVILVIVALVVATRLGLGPAHLRDALTDRRRGARVRSADEYRAEAESLAASGDFKEAVRARFRAIIRELEERAILDPRPGRTAGEIAREGSTAVPSIREDLHAVAATFNRAWYSRVPATRADYDTVRDADERIRAARLVAA
jgi:hypothetical protein